MAILSHQTVEKTLGDGQVTLTAAHTMFRFHSDKLGFGIGGSYLRPESVRLGTSRELPIRDHVMIVRMLAVVVAAFLAFRRYSR